MADTSANWLPDRDGDSEEATQTLCDSGPDEEWLDWETQAGNALGLRHSPGTEHIEDDDA